MKKIWDYEKCKKAASTCKTYREFCLTYPQAYAISHKNGWDFIKINHKKPGYWTYDNCKKVASKFKNTTEFVKQYPGAYDRARKKGWLWDWFKRKELPKNYWTYNRCLQESKKYKTYSEFRDNSNVAYEKSYRKNNWIKDFIWLKNDLKTIDNKSKIYSIYKYYFKEKNAVYIGLSKNIHQRDKTHRNQNKKKISSVLEFSLKNNLSIPEIIVIEKQLTSDEAKIREHYWVEFYKFSGYKIINKAKTGLKSSSCGGPLRKWTFDKCCKVAKKCISRTDFEKKYPSAYNSCIHNKWIEKISWLKPKIHPNGYWTYDRCLQEAQKYKTKKEFRDLAASTYVACCRNNWIQEINKFWEKK